MVTKLIVDLFPTYTNVQSLRCTPETNIISYANYTIKKKRRA